MGPRGSRLVLFSLLFPLAGPLNAQVSPADRPEPAPLPPPATAASSPSSPQEPGAPVRPADTPDPVLARRPPPRQPAATSAITPAGHLFLDVVVNDAAGKSVSGLQPWDFKVLDNNHPVKILSFRSFDGVNVRPDRPVEVILLIDELNLPFTQVSFVKSDIARFLRQNGGRLAQPVTIMRLTESGLQIQPRPSLDGNALLNVVNQIKGHISAINAAMGTQGALQRTQISVHQLAGIAENETRKPGRKLLIWVGPGWPMLQNAAFRFSENDHRQQFDSIVELTNRLRESRIVVYSVSPQDPSMGGGPARSLLYKDFLKGVPSARQADIGNLALKVLVTNTGGRIFGPDNDLAAQINRCMADAGAYYSLSFDPPKAEHLDEYHDLKVQVSQPGLDLRTNSGYYNEPAGN